MLVATGEAAVVAALALDLGMMPRPLISSFVGGGAGAFATDGRFTVWFRSALALAHGWDEEQRAQYLEQSIYRWAAGWT